MSLSIFIFVLKIQVFSILKLTSDLERKEKKSFSLPKSIFIITKTLGFCYNNCNAMHCIALHSIA